MCGIFGAVGNNIDHSILQQIASEALRRGPQAYGIAYLKGNELFHEAYPHAIKPKTAFRNVGADCSGIIGNCRLATSGSFREEKNNQPMILSEIAVSHNGNVRNYLQIADEIGAELETDCDSEIICHLIAGYGVEESLRRLSAEAPMALLILQNNKIYAYRKGQPLYEQCIEGCHYFCSRPFGKAVKVKEGKLFEFGG